MGRGSSVGGRTCGGDRTAPRRTVPCHANHATPPYARLPFPRCQPSRHQHVACPPSSPPEAAPPPRPPARAAPPTNEQTGWCGRRSNLQDALVADLLLRNDRDYAPDKHRVTHGASIRGVPVRGRSGGRAMLCYGGGPEGRTSGGEGEHRQSGGGRRPGGVRGSGGGRAGRARWPEAEPRRGAGGYAGARGAHRGREMSAARGRAL